MPNQYIFLPWLQKGMAKQISEVDPLKDAPVADARAKIKLSVSVVADESIQSPVSQEVLLVGPGDITGIEKSAVVKTDPAAGLTSFEPNFFPYVEFYEEDFPWRYTPGKAAGDKRLRPWICLIVLEETEFQRIPNKLIKGTQNIRIGSESISHALPIPEQSWAWVHVQVNEGTLIPNELTDTNTRNQKVASILASNPNLGVSRLLCSRKLRPTTKYSAFVVPAFEKGRLAGLGLSKAEIDAAGRFKSSWSIGQTSSVDLPVYYEWSFRTGTEDFEAMAKKITPQDLTGTEVGKLWMDASDSIYGNKFEYSGNLSPEVPERKGFLPFQGALVLPTTKSSPQALPPSPPLTTRTGVPEKEFVKSFAGLINLGVQYRFTQKSALTWSTSVVGNDQDDPLLVPPIYGKWYVNPEGGTTVDPLKTNTWLEQLNLDPAFRAAAGLGAEIVREFQDDYVTRAWRQLAENRKNLNKELQRLRFAQEVTTATYKKHFPQDINAQAESPNKLLALTQSFLPAVKSEDANLSVAGKINNYKPDTAFVLPAYRRLTRSNGPVLNRTKTQNAYKIVMAPPTIQFVIFSFIAIPNPPFQNFNCSDKLIKFDTASIVSILIGGLQPSLQNPDWFGNDAGNFPIARGKFADLIKQLQETVMRKPAFVSPATVDIKALSMKVQARIVPAASFKIRYQSKIPQSSAPAVATTEVISPNSFNPSYSDPTYERLGNLKRDLFIPNLDLIKPNSFALLEANPAFIEAYLTGMNHELAGEFLWRGYPADLNATFFRQFWDKSDSASSTADKSDIQFIRKWNPANSLGNNGPGGVSNPLVFVIKAELVKKYPNLVVYAQKAKMTNNNKNRVPDTSQPPMLPIFLSGLSPDYLFAGFPISKTMALGNAGNPPDGGYYFIIAERPAEVHFGLDQTRKAFNTWNDLAWTDIPNVTDYIDLQKDIPSSPPPQTNGLVWGKGETPITTQPAAGVGDSAQMAAILNQKPVRIFVHASMLTK